MQLNNTNIAEGYFDITLGNPPYIKEGRITKELFKQYKNSAYYQGKMDLWYMFACNGIDLLKKGGLLCFIATNNWVTSAGASILRNKVVSDTQIKQLVDFGNFMIFESASIQTMVMLFAKNNSIDSYPFDYRKLQGNTILSDANDLLNKKSNLKATYISPQINRDSFKNSYLNFASNEKDYVLAKIAHNGICLIKSEVAQGIVFPQDFLNKKNQLILSRYDVGKGVFALQNHEKNELNLSAKELELIKPYYTTNQVHRYYSNPKNELWLIYTDSSFKNSTKMNDYPNLKNHLDKFSSVITSDNKPYGLHRAREERFFKGEKIIVQRKCVGQPSFSYSDFDCYVSATFYVIKTDRYNTKYLVGLLNSKLIEFWLKHKGKMQGDNYQLDKEPLLAIPISKANDKITKIIENDVTEIINLKSQNKETLSFEQHIDILIYQIYNLTYDEVKIIEPNFILSKKEYEDFKV